MQPRPRTIKLAAKASCPMALRRREPWAFDSKAPKGSRSAGFGFATASARSRPGFRAARDSACGGHCAARTLAEQAERAGVRLPWGERVEGIGEDGVETAKRAVRRDGCRRGWRAIACPPMGGPRSIGRAHAALRLSRALCRGAVERLHGNPLVRARAALHHACRRERDVRSGDVARIRICGWRMRCLCFRSGAALRGAREPALSAAASRASRRLKAVRRGRVALVGDASGSVDAITGEGMCPLFQQGGAGRRHGARRLLALRGRALAIMRRLRFMANLMLMLDGRRWLQRCAIGAMAFEPGSSSCCWPRTWDGRRMRTLGALLLCVSAMRSSGLSSIRRGPRWNSPWAPRFTPFMGRSRQAKQPALRPGLGNIEGEVADRCDQRRERQRIARQENAQGDSGEREVSGNCIPAGPGGRNGRAAGRFASEAARHVADSRRSTRDYRRRWTCSRRTENIKRGALRHSLRAMGDEKPEHVYSARRRKASQSRCTRATLGRASGYPRFPSKKPRSSSTHSTASTPSTISTLWFNTSESAI